MVGNLVGNAIKFTEQGHVDLSVWLEEAPLQLRAAVRDTGRGISDLDRSWNSFQQEDATISASHGGSGLGEKRTRTLRRAWRAALRFHADHTTPSHE